VVQVAREPGVARETGPMPLTQSRPPWLLPRSQIGCRPAGAPRPVLPSHWRLGSLASRKATVSLVPQTTDSTHVSDGQVARLPDTQPSHVRRLPHVRPGRRKPSPRRRPGLCTPASGRPARPTSVVSRPPSPADVRRLPAAQPGRRPVSRPRRSGRHGGRPRPRRWAGSWQRIDGVSRLLPYSDLLALTSSSRRGEGVSDRGSWKR
jgi:hypothetical protein